MNWDDEIAEVRGALAHIPHEVAMISTTADEYECRIEVVPTTDNKCSFWLGFGTYGTYGLCFGHGLCFEDVSIAEFRPNKVVNAILQGHVRETLWRRGTKVFKSKGVIVLDDGRELSDTAVLRPSFLPLGKGEEIHYFPYV